MERQWKHGMSQDRRTSAIFHASKHRTAARGTTGYLNNTTRLLYVQAGKRHRCIRTYICIWYRATYTYMYVRIYVLCTCRYEGPTSVYMYICTRKGFEMGVNGTMPFALHPILSYGRLVKVKAGKKSRRIKKKDLPPCLPARHRGKQKPSNPQR